MTMLGSLLALALVATPLPRQVAVYPVHHPSGRDAQAVALQRLLEASLVARGLIPVTTSNDGYASCSTPTCLESRVESKPGQVAVVANWTSFGDGAVLTVVAVDDREGHEAFELAAPATSESQLPLVAANLAAQLGDKLDLPPPGEVRRPDPDHLTFGLALKAGNTVGAVAPGTSKLSGLNLRFSLEGDYLAAPEFWPFVDLSVVLARDANGQSFQLVPVLIGAKYVFRKGHDLRPFAGMALGLDFLSQNLDAQTGSTSFAVYGVGGVDWMLFPQLALVAETSANLNLLEASSGAGLVFAVGFNFGAVVLF